MPLPACHLGELALGEFSNVNADEDLSENADGDLTHRVPVLPDRQFRVDPPPC